MKIMLVTPTALPAITGNAVTVERIRKEITAQGHPVEVVDASKISNAGEMRDVFRRLRPDLVHCYHAYKAGRLLVSWFKDLAVPLVVTLPGTDMNYHVNDPAEGDVIRSVLERADRIMTHNLGIVERVRKQFPGVSSKMVTLCKGVELEFGPYDMRNVLNIPADAMVFFLPAGLRRIKRNLFAVEPLRRVRAKNGNVRLVLSGPILEEDFGQEVHETARRNPWVHEAGVIPFSCMGSAYQACDVVLNTSEAEGLPNTLLEAMMCRRPILASDIPGNRELVEEGVNGFLYTGADDFRARAERLVADAKLRDRMGEAGYRKYLSHHTPQRETAELLGLYQQVIAAWTGSRP